MGTGWFRRVKSEFTSRFESYAGKPITYVEIGCWRGSSAEWVCQHVLTHPTSQGVGIDPYTPTGRETPNDMALSKEMAIAALLPYLNWRWNFEDSLTVLRNWDEPIDVLYIDGDHNAHHVMQDFVLAFPWLRPGSTVIFDDYLIGKRKRIPHVPEAVAAVLVAFEDFVLPLPGNEWQFALTIREPTKARRRYSHQNAQHIIDWFVPRGDDGTE